MSILDVIKRSNDMMPEGYKGMSRKDMETRVAAIKKKFGRRLFIPGHHYQKDEVIQFADQTGDSLQLAQIAEKTKKRIILFFVACTLWQRPLIC